VETYLTILKNVTQSCVSCFGMNFLWLFTVGCNHKGNFLDNMPVFEK